MSDRICSVEDCTSKRIARGMCGKHYRRVKLYGDPNAYFPNAQPRICSVDGCSDNKTARGLCNSHYAKWKRYGDPLAENKHHSNPEDAFMARTKRDGDCMLWTGAKIPSGYGTIWDGTKVVKAHRYAWERVNGQLSKSEEIDHICWNRDCVNIEHLRVVNRGQNMSYRKGGNRGSASGIRNVSKSPSGWKVEITKDKVRHFYGHFESLDEAAVVAEQARKELFGEFAGRG